MIDNGATDMLELHPEILERDGKKQFAVLPYEEFLAIQEILEDWDDFKAIEEAKSQDNGGPGYSSGEIRKVLGLP